MYLASFQSFTVSLLLSVQIVSYIGREMTYSAERVQLFAQRCADLGKKLGVDVVDLYTLFHANPVSFQITPIFRFRFSSFELTVYMPLEGGNFTYSSLLFPVFAPVGFDVICVTFPLPIIISISE